MNLKKIIKDNGYTLDALAAKMTNRDGTQGVTRQSVISIIQGNPSIGKLQEIANIIGVPVSVLVAEPSDESITGIINYNGKAIQANNFCELQAIMKKIKKDIEKKKRIKK